MNLELKDTEEERGRKQKQLDSSKGQVMRNMTGDFSTPYILAEQIVRQVIPFIEDMSDGIRFLEPCLGTGSFYSALLSIIPEESIESALGIEIDKNTYAVARELWATSKISIREADFTKLVSPETPEKLSNLIITNPPYVRHHHISRTEKIRLAKRLESELGIRISGLSGLYCYFLLLAHNWLADSGTSVWLIPSEFMDVNYGKALRKYLAEQVSLRRLHRFDAREVQFPDALVSSAVVIFQKQKPSPDQKVQFTFGGALSNPLQSFEVTNSFLAKLDKWNALNLEGNQSFEPDAVNLSEIFKIKRGIATGANSFFILPLEVARIRNIPSKYLKPILPGPKEILGDVVEEDKEHFPKLTKKLVVIDCDLPEAEIKSKHPDFWRYIELGIRSKVNKKYLTMKRAPWYSQEQRDPPPFLCSYLGRKHDSKGPFRFIWNKSNAIATNVFLMMYPIGQLKEHLVEGRLQYVDVLRALHSLKTEAILGAGRVYGGGLYKLEPSELGSLRVEFLKKLQPSALAQIGTEGGSGQRTI